MDNDLELHAKRMQLLKNLRKVLLEKLIERARHHVMTEEELEAQRRSWEEAEEALSAWEQSTTILPHQLH